jgi:hypothetical protein
VDFKVASAYITNNAHENFKVTVHDFDKSQFHFFAPHEAAFY